MFLICVLMSGCTSTRYVPMQSAKTDSIYLSMQQRDSIYIRDSVVIHHAGDTVYVDKVRYRYRDRSVRDTVYRYLDREVRVPYPVEKPLCWWDRLVLEMSDVVLWVLVVYLLFLVYLHRRKYRKN